MTNPTSPGRTARDIQLARALGILALVGLIGLVAGGIRLAPLLEEETATQGEKIAGWLEVLSLVPWPVALVLALDGFRVSGEARSRRLRLAGFVAAGGFAVESAGLLIGYIALEGYTLPNYRGAVLIALLSRLVLTLTGLTFAFAIAQRDWGLRERRLRRTLTLFGVGYGLSAISAAYFAVAFSHYPDHQTFTDGFLIQALGAAGVAVSAFVAAWAFRRSSRADAHGAAVTRREGALFKVAGILVICFAVICLGQVYEASGATEIGYSVSAAAASWIAAVAGLGSAAALVCAAIGFRRAASA